MSIGEVIRKYRKVKNMTQEEMADRLGVTASAVNKWENGNSMPDIMLLAPIARLLNISLDMLLSFQEDLTDEEINRLVKELNDRLKNGRFEDGFQWAKEQMEKYPNCEHLCLRMAIQLNSHQLFNGRAGAGEYDYYIKNVFERLLNSNEEYVKTTAADSLYGICIREEQYEKAEEYLQFFSSENPERKRKFAFLCDKTGRTSEAYKAYEELLFSGYQLLSTVFNSMFTMRMREKDLEKAEYLAEKLKQLARLFEMGEYPECATQIEVVRERKDIEETYECARHMLDGMEKMASYGDVPLYEHMTFKEVSKEFKDGMKEKLLELYRDEEQFGYMAEDARWRRMLGER